MIKEMKLIIDGYIAQITKDSDGYILDFTDLPGCHTCGESFDETVRNGAEALELYLDCASKPSLEDLGIECPNYYYTADGERIYKK